MIIAALSERYSLPFEYFYAQKNLVNLIALIDILNVQAEMQQERIKEENAQWQQQGSVYH